MNDYEKIIEECRTTIALDKYNTEAYSKWREAIKNLQEPDLALHEYESTIEKNLDTSDAYNEFGNLFFYLKRYPEAIEQYKKAIEKDDKYIYAIHNRGLALERLQKYEEAVKCCNKAIELKPNYKEAYNTLGFTLCKLHKYEAAIDCFKRAIAIDNQYSNAYINWRESIKNLPKPEQSLSEYRVAIERNLNTPIAFYDYGILLFEMERYTESIDQFKKALELNDKYTDASYNMGLVLDRLQRFDEAIEWYNKTIDLDPTFKEVYNSKGLTLCRLDKNEEAIDNYKKAIEIDPQNTNAFSNWREVIKKLKIPDQMLNEYQSLIEKNLDTSDAYNDFGNLLFILKRYSEAIDQYNKALDKDAKFQYAYFNLGLSLNQLQRYDEAIDAYKRVIVIDNKFGDAYQSLGWAFITTRRMDEAIETFKNAILNIEKNKDSYFGWAYALENIGRYEESFEKYELSAKCDQNDPYPVHNIAALFEKLGRYRNARKNWIKALELYENNVEAEKKKLNSDYFQYYGSIYQFSTLQDLDKAEYIYNIGLIINPEHTGLLFNLCRLYLAKRNDLSNEFVSDIKNGSKSEHYFKALEYARRAEKVLKARSDKDNNADILAELGSLYKEIKNYKDAEDCFTRAVTINNTLTKGLTFLGAVHMLNENFKNAIVRFKEAGSLEPDNLDIRSNLAEAYLKAGMIDASEKEYCEILDIAPYHMDSLIGIGQAYITMGEDANTRKDFVNAELMFANADNYYCETIRLMQQPEDSSKILSNIERSSVFYSKGYNEVMLYEIQKKQDVNQLKIALEDFRKVEKGTPNYYKAQRAITKINGRIHPPQGMLHKVGPILILAFSLVVFILAQLLFTFGKPVLGFSDYMIDKSKLEKRFAAKVIDPSVLIELKREMEQRVVFSSPGDFEEQIKQEFGDSIASKINSSELLLKSGDLTIKAFQPLESGFYVLITFGCLLFMIAGLYLSEISKLKVGALELEKSTIDQISTSSSLGITR